MLLMVTSEIKHMFRKVRNLQWWWWAGTANHHHHSSMLHHFVWSLVSLIRSIAFSLVCHKVTLLTYFSVFLLLYPFLWYIKIIVKFSQCVHGMLLVFLLISVHFYYSRICLRILLLCFSGSPRYRLHLWPKPHLCCLQFLFHPFVSCPSLTSTECTWLCVAL